MLWGAHLTHYWYVRHTRPEWRGRRCRILARSVTYKDSILVEFEDGSRVVTGAGNVRPL